MNLTAEMPGICILDSKPDLSAFAATHLLITKKKLSPIAIASALETILEYAVVLGGRAYLRYLTQVRNEGYLLHAQVDKRGGERGMQATLLAISGPPLELIYVLLEWT